MLLGVAYAFRAPICRAVGYLWVINDSEQAADAVVVLGGGTDWRPIAAARLYHDGKAGVILLPNLVEMPSVQLGARESDTVVERAILTKLNVPPQAVSTYAREVKSCHDEAVGLAEWVHANKVKSVLIPTDPLNTRRVKWIFERKLKGTGVTVLVKAVDPPGYNLENWWEREEGVVNFIVEGIKLTYYHLHY